MGDYILTTFCTNLGNSFLLKWSQCPVIYERAFW